MITGSKRGHEDYEPPVRGDLSQVGTRRAHDMWAVGCVVAEMVLSRLSPSSGLNALETARLHVLSSLRVLSSGIQRSVRLWSGY